MVMARQGGQLIPRGVPAKQAIGELDGSEEREIAQEQTIPLTGRVVFPAGVPADEQLVAVLNGARPGEAIDAWKVCREGEPKFEIARECVRSDGSFSLSMPYGLGQAWIEIEARYLALDEPFILTDLERPSALEIKPVLGGGLRFVFVSRPELAADPHQLIGRTLQLYFAPERQRTGPPFIRTAGIGPDLSVGFLGLLPDRAYRLDSDVIGRISPFASIYYDGELRARAGEVRVIELPLEDGLVMGGQILDLQDRPIEGALVCLTWGRRNSGGFRLTGVDGRFRFEGVSPLLTSIPAAKDGYEERAVTRTELSAGLVVEDVVLRLPERLH